MSRHYLHLSDFTSGPGVDPIQGPGDNEEGLHGPGGDLGPGHPVVAALDDVAIAADAVADAALSVAEAPPDALDSVDGAGVEPPTNNAGVMEHVYADIIYGPGVEGDPGLNYEEIRLSDDDNNADVTDEDADSLLVNRSLPELVNGVNE